MDAFEQNRRSFLFSMGGLGVTQALPRSLEEAQVSLAKGYVISATEGEHLIHFRDQGSIFIKVSTATGSTNVAMGTQQVMKGTGIPTHRHFQMDETFFVLEGSGTFILNEVRCTFEKGGTIFIPRNSWHGFENPDHELLLLWIVAPPGLDNFFRETCNPPGAPPKQLTRAQIKQIALKYGTEFK